MWTFSSHSFWSEAAAHSGQPGADLIQDLIQDLFQKPNPLKSTKITLLKLGKGTAMSTGHRGRGAEEQEEHKQLWGSEDAALAAAH